MVRGEWEMTGMKLNLGCKCSRVHCGDGFTTVNYISVKTNERDKERERERKRERGREEGAHIFIMSEKSAISFSFEAFKNVNVRLN